MGVEMLREPVSVPEPRGQDQVGCLGGLEGTLSSGLSDLAAPTATWHH